MINKSFPDSESLSTLPRAARLTFVLLWTCMDDEGYAHYNARALRQKCYPLDDMTDEEFTAEVVSLAFISCIEFFEADGKLYIHCKNWSEYQKINRATPSKISPLLVESYPLTEDTLSNHGGLTPNRKERNRTEGIGYADTDTFCSSVRVEGRAPVDNSPVDISKTRARFGLFAGLKGAME